MKNKTLAMSFLLTLVLALASGAQELDDKALSVSSIIQNGPAQGFESDGSLWTLEFSSGASEGVMVVNFGGSIIDLANGVLAVPATVPASSSTYAPPPALSLGGGFGSLIGSNHTYVVPDLSGLMLAGDRPNFKYNAPGREFLQDKAYGSGQKGMALGRGLPVGTKRYVPIGEY